MVKSAILLAVISTMAGMSLIGYGVSSEHKVDSPTANAEGLSPSTRGAHAGYLEKWKRFKRGSEQTIKTNEYRILAFKIKMEDSGPWFKGAHFSQTIALEQINTGLKKQLEKYQDEGELKCEAFRTHFKEDLNGVGRSMSAVFKDDK